MPKHLSMVGCGGFGPATADEAIRVSAAARGARDRCGCNDAFRIHGGDPIQGPGNDAPRKWPRIHFIANHKAFNKRITEYCLMRRASHLRDYDRLYKQNVSSRLRKGELPTFAVSVLLAHALFHCH